MVVILSYCGWKGKPMRRISLCLGLIAVLAMTSSCRSQKLTRDSAKDILNKVGLSDQFHQFVIGSNEASQFVKIDPGTAQKLATLMDFNQFKSCLPDRADIRLVSGKYVLCPGYIPPGIDAQHPGLLVPLFKPVGWRIIEITGISDDSNNQSNKVVEFTWKYDLSEYPQGAERIFNLTPPAQRKALLRLYDDGWRFVEFR